MAGYMIYLRKEIDEGLKAYMTGEKTSVGLAINELVEKQLRTEGFLDVRENAE